MDHGVLGYAVCPRRQIHAVGFRSVPPKDLTLDLAGHRGAGTALRIHHHAVPEWVKTVLRCSGCGTGPAIDGPSTVTRKSTDRPAQEPPFACTFGAAQAQSGPPSRAQGEGKSGKPFGTGLAFTLGNAKRQPIGILVGHQTGGP